MTNSLLYNVVSVACALSYIQDKKYYPTAEEVYGPEVEVSSVENVDLYNSQVMLPIVTMQEHIQLNVDLYNSQVMLPIVTMQEHIQLCI